jgi:hypothetical protein
MNFAEAAIRRLVPEAFREFLPFVSPSGLRVISKEKVLTIALETVARTVSNARYDEEFARVSAAIADSPLQGKIEVVRTSGGPLAAAPLSPAVRTAIGETVLELYFFLIDRPVAFYLDLRPSFFSWDPASGKLRWQPSRLWFPRTPEFADRVRDLYRGFFRRSSGATTNGIALYRWDAKPSAGFDERMEALMRKHFGDAESEPITFRITQFRETFHLIFEEAITSHSRFHPELTFLGTTLAGMYLTLELLGEPLDVAGAYTRIAR